MTEENLSDKKCQYPTECAEAIVTLAKNSRRQFRILSPELEHALFDSEELASELVALLRRHRNATVQLLISDNSTLIKRKHQLALTAQRLPSHVEIRILQQHPSWPGDTLVIADKDSYLHLEASARYARCQYDYRAISKSHALRFEELWNAATIDPEFRVLSFL